MTNTQYNFLITPVIILIRLPLMLPLWLLMTIGQWAEKVGLRLQFKLPGYK